MKEISTGIRIGIIGLEDFSAGRQDIIDERLQAVKETAHSAKKAYVQVELVTEFERLKECDGIISTKDKQIDLIISDLDFIEKRMSNTQDEAEGQLLNKIRVQLEKEDFLFRTQLSEDEKRIVSAYSLISLRPIFLAGLEELSDKNKILFSALSYFGYICFFTANERDARAWPIKKGTTCWQASGLIHSDIQQGFIRAEVISFKDLISDGGINQAKANNHFRLEEKEYIVQDGDLIKFRFNK